MIFKRRWLCSSLLIGSLSASMCGCTITVKAASNCDNVQILSAELLVAEAESYCQYALSERNKVEAFWGATWKEPIRIHVDSSYKISMALVPAYQGDRGFMQMPLNLVREKRGALLHELVHIYAPNDNRFLAEGLAVYLQSRMGGNPAFPNFGKDLKIIALQRRSEVVSLNGLNSVRTPKPLYLVVNEQTAYILAGSFVGFLIEKYGLYEFKKLYETGNYDTVYGKSLEILDKEWRSSLTEK